MIDPKEHARSIAKSFFERGDALGWFEALYASAENHAELIPWAELEPNRLVLEWLEANHPQGETHKALVIGCGLGDDAELLSRYGFSVTAFDISESAIRWCQERFPNSNVEYVAADITDIPAHWQRQFDFIYEAGTIQSLPVNLRDRVLANIGALAAPGGEILIICHACEPGDERPRIPWPVHRGELAWFIENGFEEKTFEEIERWGTPPARAFQVFYKKTI